MYLLGRQTLSCESSCFGESFRRLPETGKPAPVKAIRPRAVNVEQEEAVIYATINDLLIRIQSIACNRHVCKSKFCMAYFEPHRLHLYYQVNV